MLIFLACESATTPFCLCLLLGACGIFQYFVGRKISSESLQTHLSVDTLVVGKHKALPHWEAEMDIVTPVMVGSC